MNHTKAGRRASRLAFYDGEEWAAIGRHADDILAAIRRRRRRQLASGNPWASLADHASSLPPVMLYFSAIPSSLPDGG